MVIDKGKMDLAMARATKPLEAVRKEVGISGPGLSRIRAGQRTTPVTAGKIARALGVDVTELLKD